MFHGFNIFEKKFFNFGNLGKSKYNLASKVSATRDFLKEWIDFPITVVRISHAPVCCCDNKYAMSLMW